MKLQLKLVSNALTLVASLISLPSGASQQDVAMSNIKSGASGFVEFNYVDENTLISIYREHNRLDSFKTNIESGNVGYVELVGDVCHITTLKANSERKLDYIDSLVTACGQLGSSANESL